MKKHTATPKKEIGNILELMWQNSKANMKTATARCAGMYRDLNSLKKQLLEMRDVVNGLSRVDNRIGHGLDLGQKQMGHFKRGLNS